MKTETKREKGLRTIERILTPPPTHWVGDGFKVHGFFPQGPMPASRMSPFFLLDYNARMNFPPSTDLLGVGPHPHRGFETVTIAYKGKVAHHDSRGGGGVIGEGDVQWMTAGSGILHKEYHEEEFNRNGGEFQMVQLWVNLPARDKMTEPRYQAITNGEMGRVPIEGGGEVEIIAGDFQGVKGPASTFSPVHLYNLKPKAGAKIEVNLSSGFTTAALMIDGAARLNSEHDVPVNNFVVFKDDGDTITFEAQEDSIILVMSGEPLNEPIASYGPFLMNTRQEIEQAINDFQSGKFGYLED